MDRQARSKLNTQIYEEACEWFIECRSGDLDDAARRAFDRWLRKSPENLSAYLEIAAIWHEGPLLDPTNKWDTDTLIAQAAGDHDNVIALSAASSGDAPPRIAAGATSTGPPSHLPLENGKVEDVAAGVRLRPPRTGRVSKWRLLAIAASIAAVGSVSGTLLWSRLSAPTYATVVGEQRSIEFADGSIAELNTRSGIKVRYSEHERTVELLEGQALFHVAKDHARPFFVSVDGTRIRAVGTQFDVYKKHSATVVTVVEGRVAVFASLATDGAGTAELAASPDEGGRGTHSSVGIRASTHDASHPSSDLSATIFLSAGEQLTVTPEVAQKTEHPNISAATAWTHRQIVFDFASLAEVAEEFNRYNQRQLIIEDPDLYGFHISGVFSSTDLGSLIRFLRERPGVHVVETASEIRVVKNIS
jgi:transmembrane sensor